MFVETEIVPLSVPRLDMALAYAASVRRFGKKNVFLLESLAGPEQDCKQSILGMNCLASIEISARRLAIQGTSSLLSCISQVVDKAFGEPRMSDGCANFNSIDEIWTVLRALNGLFRISKNSYEFNFGYLACFGYDVAHLIEKLPHHIPGEEFPLIILGVFQSYLIVGPNGYARLAVNHANLFPVPPMDAYRAIAEAAACPVIPRPEGQIPAATVTLTMEKSRFLQNAETALRHIRMGDIYQLQLGHEIRVQTTMEPFSLYQRLRRFNPSPYMFLCHMAGHDLIGSSPENYIRLEEGRISMRPIAGTIAKAKATGHQKLVDELASSRKENAEHIMLVDLCRNDIARICDTDTLDVPSLMAVEEFSELFHLVSTVSGRMAPGQDVFDVIRATFPAGTMTGAPKIRAMEIIESLEVSRRGVYSGAIGLIGPDNYANMALCIRMASHKDQQYRLRACAGIVADSDPEKEWCETLVKMNAVFKSLTDRKLEL